MGHTAGMDPKLNLAPLRAAIVDLDGTMIDTLGDFVVALNCMLEDLSLPGIERPAIERMIGKGSEHLIRLTLAHAGVPADRYDDAWTWVADLASFHAQGDYTAATLLDWIGRETGRSVRFDGPATRTHAETLLLHGAEGLSPQDTLAVVAATTDLRYELEPGTIVISAAQY